MQGQLAWDESAIPVCPFLASACIIPATVRNPTVWQWAVSIVVPALAGFIGILVGAWLTARREKSQRRYAFVQRQLQDLYSPLLGLRAEIRLRSELCFRIGVAADAEWRRLCEEARQTADPVAAYERLHRGYGEKFESTIQYDNRQFAEAVIPAYRRMVTVLRDNLWLAEPETRQYFGTLLEFVEIWERWVSQSIPHEVVKALEHSEAKLEPFYDHVEAQHDLLRELLRQA